MSRKVDVTVFHRGHKIEGPIERPVRLLRSGVAAVIYGGEAYPLLAGGVIDTAEPGQDKGRCIGFVEEGQAIPYAAAANTKSSRLAPSRWHLESNRYGHYLVFDASEDLALKIVDVIETSGLGVRRWDASAREADDGYHYDWFIRLGFDGDRRECLRQLESLLSDPNVTSRPSAPAAPLVTPPPTDLADKRRIKDLEARLGELAQHVEQLNRTHQDELKQAEREALGTQQQLEAQARALGDLLIRAQGSAEEFRHKAEKATRETRRALAEVEATKADAESARRHHENERERWHYRNQMLVKQTEALASRNDGTAVRQLEELRKDNEVLAAVADAERRKFLDDAQARDQRIRELEEENLQIQVINEDLAEQQKSLLDELTEVERDRKEALRMRRPTGRVNADDLLGAAFPHLAFDEDFVECLNGFPDWNPLMRILWRLQDKDATLLSTAIRGRANDPRIFEVKHHIGTGDPDGGALGRLYYVVLQNGQICVTLHRKKNDDEQRQFLDRLAQRYRKQSAQESA